MTPILKDHVELGKSRLLSQFKDKPLINYLLEAYLKQTQKTENGLFTLLDNRSLTNATGEILDYIGKIVGESRKGRNDNDYRQGILVKITINRSNGTPNQILQAVKGVTNATKTAIFEHPNAYAILRTDGSIDDRLEYCKLIKDIKPAGVKVRFTIIEPDHGKSLIPTEGVNTTGGTGVLAELVPDVFQVQLDPVTVEDFSVDPGTGVELFLVQSNTLGTQGLGNTPPEVFDCDNVIIINILVDHDLKPIVNQDQTEILVLRE